MDIKITGQQISLGESLMDYVKTCTNDTVTKYFHKAVSTSVIFSKDSSSSGFKAEIITNDGNGRGIVKGNSIAHDIYVAFDNALKKINVQLNKYKKRLTSHQKSSISDITTEIKDEIIGKKSVFAPYEEDIDIELEPVIIAEKVTSITHFTVKDAVMHMDLHDLPTLLFINSKTDKINCVYYRKDGNISWIELEESNKKVMIAIIGVVVVFTLVFGGYVWAGGKLEVILEALPHELVVMGGATIGAFLISNDGSVAKATLKAFGKVFKGHKWHKEHYIEILTLMFSLLKLVRSGGIVAIESHIENPKESNIFQKYPHVLQDKVAVSIICDTLRLMTMDFDNPYQMEDLFNKAISKIHHESSAPAGALQSVADGLPAIGIVAAVLGVIKTMASVDQPPIILGGMIASALVGTFMGVFIAYCFIGPFANKLNHTYHEETMFYYVIRDIMVCFLQGSAPQAAVEVGRNAIPSLSQPTFQEVEEAMQNASKA